jgi:hypothetical protein
MDDTLPIPFPDDDTAAPPAAAWPQAVMQASAKLLDSELWFSEAHCWQGAAGEDLP